MSARWMMIAILGWSGVALAEDLIVIDVSNASGIAVGDVIGDGKAIELPAGAKATLIGASGKTVPLNGPYKGVPSAGTDKGDGRLMVALTSLVQGRSDGTAKVGAVRAFPWRTPDVKQASDVYKLDGSLNEPQCLLKSNLNQVALVFDPAKHTSNQVTLMSVDSGRPESLVMAKADARTGVVLPPTVALEDGNSFLVDMEGRKEATQFNIKVLDKPASNDVQRAVQLMEAGCTEQAKLMIEVVKKSAQ